MMFMRRWKKALESVVVGHDPFSDATVMAMLKEGILLQRIV